MERITFLIESTHLRLTCLLNPEDRDESLTLERSSGIAREDGSSTFGASLSDNPVQARGWGDTRLTLKLLFDVSLSPPSLAIKDVRELTRPLWELTEHSAGRRSTRSGAGAEPTAQRNPANRGIPQVRIFWGKGWEIPAVVESVAERYERFSEDGRPQRSWMTLRLLRVSDEIPPSELPARFSVQALPELDNLAGTVPGDEQPDSTWDAHVKVGGGTQGDQLWQLAARYLGDPRLWRWIALYNQVDDPNHIQAGTALVIPPLQKLSVRRNRGRVQ
jgi:hypothetical protein